MKMRVILMPTMCLIAVAGISFAAGKDAATPSAPAEAVPAKQYESYGNTQIVEMENDQRHVQPQIPCGDCRLILRQLSSRPVREKTGGGQGQRRLQPWPRWKPANIAAPAMTAIPRSIRLGPETCKTCHGSDMKQPETVVFNRACERGGFWS